MSIVKIISRAVGGGKIFKHFVLGLALNPRNLLQLANWMDNNFPPNSPQIVKWSTLERHGGKNSCWIETGTYRGDTTQKLSLISDRVFSIEPSEKLFKEAEIRLSGFSNVTLICGTSENSLEEVFEYICQEGWKSLSLWLDGHYSEGGTYKGVKDSPILEELKIISNYISNFEDLVILIDDVRYFDPRDTVNKDYPSIGVIIDWVESHGFSWSIEFDIFIAKKNILFPESKISDG